MRFKIAFAAVVALLVSPAWAAPEGSGFYAGAGIGASDLAAGGFNGNDFAFKIFAGYDFMKYVGVEGAYMDGGNPSDHGFDIGLTGWDLAVRGMWPVTDNFELFAKLGYVWWDVSTHGYGSDSGDDLMYGAGAGYRFGDHLGLRGEWERMDIKDTSRADLWTVSGYWKF
jgi:OmpA-OmpF porin, OOP family